MVDAPLTPFVSVTSGELDLRLAAWVVNQVDQRSRLLDADRLVYESYDPYIFVRDAYLQRRRYLALDGNVPEDESYLDEAELDDAEAVEPEAGPE